MLKLGGGDLGQCIHPRHSQYQISLACKMTLQTPCTTYEHTSSFVCPPSGETSATDCTHRLCSISITASPCISDLFVSESLILHARHLVCKYFPGTLPRRYVPGNWTVFSTYAPPLWNPVYDARSYACDILPFQEPCLNRCKSQRVAHHTLRTASEVVI
ncbi:hypothetical protein PSPO01_13206 [Paraphaeosphaeria sporulosa]